ncbi:TPA: hypothetical protein QIT10_004122 [Enterobacter bugandensis]|nr:hypothetical protein [Enterobacter bugandensis]HEP0376677.1 hypothetical protein [Enterobacter bugandensis]
MRHTSLRRAVAKCEEPPGTSTGRVKLSPQQSPSETPFKFSFYEIVVSIFNLSLTLGYFLHYSRGRPFLLRRPRAGLIKIRV